MVRDHTIRKATSFKSFLRFGRNKDKTVVDINSNVSYNQIGQTENETKKVEKSRRSSVPWKTEYQVTSFSKAYKEPEIIHNYKTFKILVLGASGVGKTSILERFVNGGFFQLHIQTVSEVYEIGIFLNFENKLKQFDLEFRDFNGDIKNGYEDLYEQEITDANACIVVYSKDIAESFDIAVETIGDIKNLKNNNTPILVVENKTDLNLTSSKIITAETFNLKNCIFESTSSKLNYNIETSMHTFIRALEEKL